MQARRYLLLLGTLAAVLVAGAILLWPSPSPTTATDADSITSPDTIGDVGRYASLALDASGNPVVSYVDSTNGDLKVLHCNDPNCSGGDESITSPDTDGSVGSYASLALDGSGDPVVSYYDGDNGDLKVLHCNDPNCSGGDESITSPDTAGDVGRYTSLVLDALGNPVVGYFDNTNDDLKVLHCNDPNCSGGDESITSPDTAGNVGMYASLALDGAGSPVMAYYDYTNGDLKVLHCNDPNCAGADESIASPDGANNVGVSASLTLDSSGNPVVSYHHGWPYSDLKVLHCNDPNCSGGDESITSPDTAGDVGACTSLVLDGSGNPVVSYFHNTKEDLKVLHCNDPDCDGGDESITSPDVVGDVAYHTSVALDPSGNPVVSYHDDTHEDLKVLHCGSANCSDAKLPPTATPTPCPTGGCPTPTPVPEVDFAIEIVGTSCTTKAAEPGVCLIPEGWQFTVDITLNDISALVDHDGDTAAGYEAVGVTLDFSGGLTYRYQSDEIVWPDGNFCMTTGLPVPPYINGCSIWVGQEESTYTGTMFEVDFSCDETDPGQFLILLHESYLTAIMAEGGVNATDPDGQESLTIQCVPPGPGDGDGDGCPDVDESGPDEMLGGRRNFFNPWDYFNPTNDGQNRVDDILAVVDHYFLSEGEPGYEDGKYDRSYLGPNDWNLGPPDGQVLVDDVLHALESYFHDCGTGIEKPTPTVTPVP
jgi:hypothetical protein